MSESNKPQSTRKALYDNTKSPSLKPGKLGDSSSCEETAMELDYDNDFEEPNIGGLSCCGSFRFFVKHSCRDLLRHKCQFGLAFCSVFVVVLSVVVVNTIISKGPLIFMKLGESVKGGYDGVFTNINA